MKLQRDEYNFPYYDKLPPNAIKGSIMSMIVLKEEKAKEIKKIHDTIRLNAETKKRRIKEIKMNKNNYYVPAGQHYLLRSDTLERYDMQVSNDRESRYTNVIEWSKYIKPFIEAGRYYILKK